MSLRCDQVRVIRDEGVGTGRFTCDFGRDQLTIEDVETESRSGRCRGLDRSVDRKGFCSRSALPRLRPFTLPEPSGSEMDSPTIFESGSTP